MAMRMMVAALIASVAVAGCSRDDAVPAGNDAAGNAAGNGASAAAGDNACPSLPAGAMPPEIRRHETMIGQPLTAPRPPLELVVHVACFPANHMIGRHLHRWPRYGYIETGSLQVRFDDGRTLSFSAGDELVESVGTPHRVVVGPEPVRMIVTDQIPYIAPPPDPLPENVVPLPSG